MFDNWVNTRRMDPMKRKPKQNVEFKKVMVNLPGDVNDAIDQYLLDPMTNKVRYGAKSQLVTRLLIAFLQSKGVQLKIETAKSVIDKLIEEETK